MRWPRRRTENITSQVEDNRIKEKQDDNRNANLLFFKVRFVVFVIVMIFSSTHEIPGKKTVKTLGLSWGSSVRSRSIGFDFVALAKSIVGGEIHAYKKLLSKARHEALRELEENTKANNANAVIGLRFTVTSLAPGVIEVTAYGTAVLVK